jgi:hypothetical protein
MPIASIGRKFDSPQQAEAADDEFYRSLTPEQRMEIFFELMSQVRDYEAEAAAGFPRVSRVAELPRR